MKKALVLGVLAFFAINIASVQNANAQDKKSATPAQTEKTAKKTVKQSKTTAIKEAKTNQATATETGKDKVVKPAAASWNTEKKDAKACCKEEGKKDCNKEVPTTKKVDPTAKNKTPEIGVPPTQNKAKKTTTTGTANGTTGTTK